MANVLDVAKAVIYYKIKIHVVQIIVCFVFGLNCKLRTWFPRNTRVACLH